MNPKQAAPGAELLGREEVGCKVVADAMSLAQRIRPADGPPEGALVLFHGRATDENDLFPLLDELDPERRLLGATARGPLTLPPGGWHWYVVRRIGFPDPETFLSTYRLAGGWLDGLLAEHGIPPERAILGGFSQGAVMTYALGAGADRPRPAGLIPLSGFIPTVEGFELGDVTGLPVAIGHGAYDPVIGVEFGREARDRLSAAGADVTYRESPMPHTVDPAFLAELRDWVRSRAETAA
jgi:phospholipase/carboxylesterase